MSQSEVAYVGIMIGAGTRDEQPELNGIAHYVEHTVFKGCTTAQGKNVTARQLITKIEGIGGEINAYTTKEETTFYAATPVAHYAQTLQLLADMVLRPTFPKHETDKEVGVERTHIRRLREYAVPWTSDGNVYSRHEKDTP